ncbi:hypothetical protein BDL97_05G097500 [Sphagnum fallax]|nr:hypothetical protein BDL97_05G097500 [Sphagnum fallax]KAH8962350.1 hypothetical protein BDL97_05G097500 [Sphagnum fallax]
MTQGLNTAAGVSPAGVRLWLAERRMQTGPLSVLSESQPESSLDALLAGNEGCSLTSQHRDGRKRKELLAGHSEEDSGASDHKRHRKLQVQSSTSSSYGSVMTSRTDVRSCDAIAERPGCCLLSVKEPVFEEQIRAARVLGLAEVDTICCSSGHDEISGGNASAIISSEEGDSQLHPCLGRFLNVDQKGGSSIDPKGRAEMHMWSDSGGLLSSQLNSFIAKEKKKLESSDTAGNGNQIFSQSEQSLLGSLYGEHSSSLQRRPFQNRSIGSGGHIGSGSMEDGPCFLAGSSTEASQERSRLENLELNPLTSMLLSRMSKRQRSTLEFCCTDSATSAVEDQSEEERKRKLAVRKSCIDSMGLQGSVYDLQGVPSSTAENTRIQDEDGAITPDPHQMFVLSSGRPSSTEEERSGKPILTIDCDFDTYFSKLML